MPITVEILDVKASTDHFDKVYNYFKQVDDRFSTYKEASEISRINRGEIKPADFSNEMKEVLSLCNQTKKETNGYFDIKNPQGILDPSGLVKGWAIFNAAKIIKQAGLKNFYIDAGGDIQTSGQNSAGKPWRVGIKNPFHEDEIIKVVYVSDLGVATSGTYIRGTHIYNPYLKKAPEGLVSLTVIGPNVYDADRFATAAFAMGKRGIEFIEELKGFEGYAVDVHGVAVMTTKFLEYNKED